MVNILPFLHKVRQFVIVPGTICCCYCSSSDHNNDTIDISIRKINVVCKSAFLRTVIKKKYTSLHIAGCSVMKRCLVG